MSKFIADAIRHSGDSPARQVEVAKSALLASHRERDDITRVIDARPDRKPFASEKRRFNEVSEEIDGLQALIDDFKPQYKHDMGAGGERTIDGPTGGWSGSGGVKMLTKDQNVHDGALDKSEVYGRLGVLAKSLTGDVDEAEVSRWMPNGMKDMLTSGGAGVIVPTPVAGFVIDLLRSLSVVNALGARTVPMSSGTLKVPRIIADPTPSWLAEGATITPGDGDMDDVTLAAKRLTAIVKFSDELDEDSDPQLAGEVLAMSLARAFAVELDRAALRGSGTGAEPTGIRNQSGVTIVPTVGAADWTTLTGAKATLEGANSAATGFVLAPRTLDAVENTPATDGHFVAPPSSIAAIPRLATTSVPITLGAGSDSEVYAGNWSDLMIGLRLRFELRRLNERYAEEGKVALRARIRADVQLAHPASFYVGTGVTN